jgi:hypothetical protein
MKKYVIAVLVLLVMSMIPTPVLSLSCGEVEFRNMPLTPGEETYLWITVTNYGEEKRDILVRLEHVIELGIGRGQGSFNAIGILDGSAGIRKLASGEQDRVRFKIFAASDADEGIYNLDVEATYTDSGSFRNRSSSETLTRISIQVEEKPPEIVVSSAGSDAIAPGSVEEITLTLLNAGKGTAKDVVLEVNPVVPPEGGSSSGISIPEEITSLLGISIPSFGGAGEKAPPLSIVGSGSRFSIGDLRPNEKANVSFNLVSDPEIKRGVYNLPITISYRGAHSSSLEYVGIRVLSKAELTVPEIRTDPRTVTPGELANLFVKVENIGNNNAKSARVEIMENEYIEGLSKYIGTIGADDDATAIFRLVVKKGAPEELPILVNITYKDDLGEGSIIESGEIKVEPTAGDSHSQNDNTSGPSVPIPSIAALALLALIVIALIFYRRRRGGKKRSNPNPFGGDPVEEETNFSITEERLDALEYLRAERMRIIQSAKVLVREGKTEDAIKLIEAAVKLT